ncbi:MAG: acyl-CoA dehydrogenase, partial [Gammaproteobacteria bacterium]|nr:acyl-CoA dehydrogenase [Gammaproteobacteria bacterium]
MDFNDTAAEAEFRAEVSTWLEANVPAEKEFAGMTPLERAKFWQKRKYDAGWACLRWPKEFGGRDASVVEQVIFNEEEAKHDVEPAVFAIGHGMCGPTMIAWATDEQNRRYMPKIASGEEVWCQLFSEPAGGSDLAALRTSAVRDGDDWIVNGQKIWTSGAQHSDYGILVVRTDPTVPKHQGLSYFFLDMKSPGVEVKPIKQISGDAGFNEVYFTDVRIPDAQRLGAVGQGWQVALTTLMNERASIGGGGSGRGIVNCTRLVELFEKVNLDGSAAIEDGAVQAKLADWYVKEAG